MSVHFHDLSVLTHIDFFSLASRGAKFQDATYFITYRNVSVRNFFELFPVTNQPAHWQQVIISAIGIPSAFIAGYTIELPFFGRRGTLAASACEYIIAPQLIFTLLTHEAGLTGAFLFASTTARSSPALLGWNCGYAFFSNVRKN